jgi:predicted Rossmann-fold nucleotide-binding protein
MEKQLTTEIESWEDLIANGYDLRNRTFQQVDFRSIHPNWKSLKLNGSTFLGCDIAPADRLYLIEQGALVINAPDDLPYQPFRNKLYSWQELLEEAPNSNDLNIFQHFELHKRNTGINEALWQRIHDHAIDDALGEYIGGQEHGVAGAKCIGVMGGHQVARTDPYYAKVAAISKRLTEEGYLIVSGGGPGIMEAANLGAFLGHRSDNSLKDAIRHFSNAPHYTSKHYIESAIEVWKNHENSNRTLAIPTWFYGHEPSNVFAPAIAKYFSNSIREDTLLAICFHGVIYAPGSAGTTQEIFMDAAQNHYGTNDYYSPMVFLGKDHYQYDTTLFPVLRRLARGKRY